jgi:PKD repeat protein
VGGDVGIPISFTGAGVTNGTAPYTFLWRFGDGTMSAGTSASHDYAVAGTYAGTLTATDALGVNSSQPFTEIVRPLPTVTLASAPSSPVAGVPARFYGNASGGTEPYRYSWVFGDGATSSFPYPAHAFSAAGSYPVQVWVNDSVGGSAHQTLSVTVASAAPSGNGSSTGSAGVPSWFWPGLAVLLVVGGAGAVVLLRSGRSKP